MWTRKLLFLKYFISLFDCLVIYHSFSLFLSLSLSLFFHLFFYSLRFFSWISRHIRSIKSKRDKRERIEFCNPLSLQSGSYISTLFFFVLYDAATFWSEVNWMALELLSWQTKCFLDATLHIPTEGMRIIGKVKRTYCIHWFRKPFFPLYNHSLYPFPFFYFLLSESHFLFSISIIRCNFTSYLFSINASKPY